MMRGEARGEVVGLRGDSITGLRRDTWNDGCNLRAAGSFRQTTLGYIMWSMGCRPMYLGVSFQESVRRRKSREDSQTCWTTLVLTRATKASHQTSCGEDGPAPMELPLRTSGKGTRGTGNHT